MNQFHNQSKLPNRFCVEFDTFKKLTFLERLKVLIGYNPVVSTSVKVDKRTGQAWTLSVLSLTPLQNERDVINQQKVLDMNEPTQNDNC